MLVKEGQLWKGKNTTDLFRVIDVRPHKRYEYAITIRYSNGAIQLRYPTHFEPHICGWELTTEETYGMCLLNELP